MLQIVVHPGHYQITTEHGQNSPSEHIQKNLFKKLEYIKKLWQRRNQPTIY